MSFIDRDFLWFLPLVWGVWLLLSGRYTAQIVLLLGASLTFYGWRHPAVVGIILTYALVDWAIGVWLEQSNRRRLVLFVGLTFNLGVLCFWKYTPLILTTLGSWLHRPELAANVTRPGGWIVPMGVSFYSFTGIAYMVDVYRRVAAVEPSLLRFSLFTSFFPHLVAGPILRAREFLTHLGPAEFPRKPEAPLEALALISRGYFKKLVLADTLGFAVDPFFAEIAHPATAGVWSLPYLYLYGWQIYFDFSGYTDIARGLGLAFGFRWPENFLGPYLAASVREFWRRWHITLSRFMRDYLYIPLGGNRVSAGWSAFAVMTTMTLSGFWHGASWTFLLWGAVHGAVLLVNRGWQSLDLLRRVPAFQKIPAGARGLLSVALTFNVVCLAWSFFRLNQLSESVEALRKVLQFEPAKLFAGGAADLSVWLLLGVYAMGVFCFARLRRGASVPEFFAALHTRPFARGLITGGVIGLLIVSILLARTGEKVPFIYFQF
ncbi:MAG TPA: MBOAT family O-acyltransferase [Chthoniobacterales bacterium]